MTDPTIDPRFHLPARKVLVLLAFLAAVFWFARPVLLPFIVGAIIAYAFTPAIDAAQKRTGRSRLLIVILIFGSGTGHPGRDRDRLRGPRVPRGQPPDPERARTPSRPPFASCSGGDSITIGDRTVTVEELATQAQAAINTFLQTPEGAIRAVEQLLHGTLDVDPRDDRDLLPAARRRAVREHPAPVPPAGRPGPDADRRRPDPRGRRAVAARPADPDRVRVGDRVDRPRADPPSPERRWPSA